MKRSLLLLVAIISGCSSGSPESWEDMKTAGRYVQRGVDALWGKGYDSRMLTSEDDFVGPYDDEFLPMRSTDLKTSFALNDQALPQPRKVPGEEGVPLLSQFGLAKGDMARLFRAVHFETDEYVVKGKDDLKGLSEIASYLKSHPKMLLAVVGHCDERASAAYNLGLGMRRANHVRALLAKFGVDPNRVYPVSKGKEEPVALGHGVTDWEQNRRVEFRIHEAR